MMNKEIGNVLTFPELADQVLEGERDTANMYRTDCVPPLFTQFVSFHPQHLPKERCSERLGKLPMVTQRGSGRASIGAQNSDSKSAPLYPELGRL